MERAAKELKAFQRIAVPAGQVRTAEIELPISRLSYYDSEAGQMQVEPLEYELMAARHSLDSEALLTKFTVR